MKTETQKIIYIEGYYVNYGIKEEGGDFCHKCVIGEWDGLEDDFDMEIFYYFENNPEDIKSFMDVENKSHTEFVITKVMDENMNDITAQYKEN